MRSKTTRHLTAVIAVLALTITACGGDGGGNGDQTTTTEDQSEQKVPLTATEFSFDPSNVAVDAGQEITLVMTNAGVVEHDFAIDGMTFDLVVQPGETAEDTATFAAGTYVFYCTIAGHREAGMEGTLVAE